MLPIAKLRDGAYPVIRNRRDLRVFVLWVTFLCVAIALAVDVLQQLLTADSWMTAVRSWIITMMLAGFIALVASSWVGRALLQLFQAKSAVEVLSRTDPLTGLPNRRAFFELAATTAPETMALVIIDIDHFKRINDTRGHRTGDEVIRVIGGMVASELGPLGNVGRIGGEEFALLSDAPVGRLYATMTAFRTRISATPIVVAGAAINVTVSAGIARHREGQTFNDLFEETDAALYAAKSAGRNCVRLARSTAEDGTSPEVRRWRSDLASDIPEGDDTDRVRSA